MERSKRKIELSDADKARIERNRVRAQLLRDSKVAISKEEEGAHKINLNGAKYIDTAGGFLINERDLHADEGERSAKVAKLAEEEALEIPLNYHTCQHCEEEFIESYLQKNFDYMCCDKCKTEENSELITKTTARDEYLLKDVDFDRREPALKFINRKNPHKSTWAEMKLYLKSQVEKRALEVHGSFEKIEEEKELREEKRELSKVKKYNKNMTELRKAVRSTLYDRRHEKHVHEFGESTYNEETDEYHHSCLTCEYEETYEQM